MWAEGMGKEQTLWPGRCSPEPAGDRLQGNKARSQHCSGCLLAPVGQACSLDHGPCLSRCSTPPPPTPGWLSVLGQID